MSLFNGVYSNWLTSGDQTILKLHVLVRKSNFSFFSWYNLINWTTKYLLNNNILQALIEQLKQNLCYVGLCQLPLSLVTDCSWSLSLLEQFLPPGSIFFSGSISHKVKGYKNSLYQLTKNSWLAFTKRAGGCNNTFDFIVVQSEWLFTWDIHQSVHS